jgi:hypothetical protein
MTGERGRPRAADLAVPALDAVVEGSWVALVYVTLQVAVAHVPAVLGPIAFAAAAGLGLAWSRAARGRLATTGAGVALGVAVGIAGWLADPAARAALAALIGGAADVDALEAALTTNAAGWLLALAFARGASHRERARDEERTGRMLERILLLAIPWAIGLALTGTDRAAFVAQATLCTLLFAGAGLLAVGLGRLETHGAAAGVDWRANRSWVAAVSLVVALMLVVSLPAAFAVGAPPLALVDAAWVSLAAAIGLVGAVIGTLGAPVLAGFEALMAALPTPQPTPLPPPSAPPPGVGEVAPVQGDPRIGLTLAILALVVLSLVLVAIVSRIRAGGTVTTIGAAEPAPAEERSIDPPRPRVRVPSVRLPRRRRPPATAADAYLALLDDLDDDPALRRLPSESPRAHAGRLTGAGRPGGALAPPTSRRAGSANAGGAGPAGPARPAAPDVDVDLLGADWAFGGRGGRAHLADRAALERAARVPGRGSGPDGRGPAPGTASTPPAARSPRVRRDLGMLVADWELARYAGRRLTAREDARGVARWRRLRAILRRGEGTGPGAT